MVRRWIAFVAACALLGCAKSHQLTDTSSTVYALASFYPSLATFITMTQASGVDEKLRGSEPVTVLAPSNDALNVLGPDKLRSLLDPDGAAELEALVNAHVFPGAFSAEDVARGKLPASLAGTRVEASKASDGTPRVAGTGKILESMEGANGFVHVIDTVLR